VYRHLAGCKHCRAYRGQLRAMREALHALHPGGWLLLSAVASKLGLAGKSTLAGLLTKTPATIGAVAALSAAAVGTTFVIGAGEPSPATIHSPVLPGGMVAKGAPLPRQTAVVVGSAHVPATVRLACPPDHRVADLLPPDARSVTAVYEPSTHPGISQAASINLSGSASGAVGVAILCRVPGPDGSLTPTAKASAAAAQPPAVVCTERDYLRAEPDGDVLGSVSGGEPVHELGRGPGWRRVKTQFGRTGWVPAGDLCGG
jgi:hypothetical protein